MTEDELQKLWDMMIVCLYAASDAGTWAFWRERFGTNHPDHNVSEIDNATQHAYAQFFAAKGLYCINKEKFDKFANDIVASNFGRAVYGRRDRDLEMFEAMKRVVEEEMVQQLEQQVLNNEEPEGYWEGDEYLPLPDSSEELDLDSY